MSEAVIKEKDGRSVYKRSSSFTRLFFFVYDSILLKVLFPLIWKCTARDLLDLYNDYISSNHLDVGAGTGFFLDHCTFPTHNPRLALLDLNRGALEKSSRRLARYNPETYCMDILEPLGLEGVRFESAGLNLLLHCLPGTMKTKGVVFKNLKALLAPGGVVFGSTFLYKDVKKSLLVTLWSDLHNGLGTLTNREDDLKGLTENLNEHFSESSVKRIGCVALFWARK
jgi:SAM-dependent methyltransferase